MNTIKNTIESVLRSYRYYDKLKIDGRQSCVKAALSFGFSKNDLSKMRSIRFSRMDQKIAANNAAAMTMQRRIDFLKIVNECKFDLEAKSSRYNCTGIDWKAFHRPSSSGGWVLIAPDEPANNWHTDDPILVKYLTKKFLSN